MAKVKHFSKEMVRDFAGVVDFYYWKGIPVAREWPKLPTVPPSEAMREARAAFTESRAQLREVSNAVRGMWAEDNKGVQQAWLDYYTGIFMRYWKLTGDYPPVVTDYTVEKL